MPKTETRRVTKELPRGKKKQKKWEDIDEEEDDDDTFEAIPKWKLWMIGAVVLLCFALLYPSVIGPILTSLIGKSPSQQAGQASNGPPVHPALNRQAGGPGGARPHMHPAASARMPHVEAQQQTGRGGMFTWMLPIYTIGVMGFLCYTLFKIMFKSKKKKNKRKGKYAYSSYDEDESDEDDAISDTGMNHKRLRTLQTRLQETEAAMSKILEQLENIAQTSNNEQETSEATSDEKKEDKVKPEEQLKNIEESMQKLTELSRIYKKQKAQLEEVSDDQIEEESSEEEADEEMDEVEMPEQASQDIDDEGIRDNESEEEEVKIEESPPKASKSVRRRPKKE